MTMAKATRDRQFERRGGSNGAEEEDNEVDDEVEKLAKAWLRRKENADGSNAQQRAYYFERADASRLVDACTRRLNADSGDRRALHLRGSSLLKLGDLEGALVDYERLLEMNPEDEGALYQRGQIKSKRNDLDGAIEDFTAVLRLNSDHVKAAYARGACRNLKGSFDEAIGSPSLLLSLSPVSRASINNWHAAEDYNLALEKDSSPGAWAPWRRKRMCVALVHSFIHSHPIAKPERSPCVQEQRGEKAGKGATWGGSARE